MSEDGWRTHIRWQVWRIAQGTAWWLRQVLAGLPA